MRHISRDQIDKAKRGKSVIVRIQKNAARRRKPPQISSHFYPLQIYNLQGRARFA
uniref:Uncharacterized protein n=1 Tax=Setaria viridis TaxID=4556 RepID=A0A4U6V7X0_SETVI|nr:hypothetical protein SEVIR_3G112900v2 [Setaria viridis]